MSNYDYKKPLFFMCLAGLIVIIGIIIWMAIPGDPPILSDKYNYPDGSIIYIQREGEGYVCADISPYLDKESNTTDWILALEYEHSSEYSAYLIRADAIKEAEKHCKVVDNYYKQAAPTRFGVSL